MRRLSPAISQRIAMGILWLLTLATIAVLFYIIFYILIKGLPHITWEFLSQAPRSMGRKGGIFPMIVGTFMVSGLAVLIAAPLGVGTAVYLTEYTRESRFTFLLRFGADCLAGIPSIIYGLFGFVFFSIALGMGLSVLSGALTLALMVLPTIIRTAEEAIRAVPYAYREASYGLGSTRWQMVTRIVLPAALPGICTGIVLSLGRSISETAAVMLTAGSALRLPQSAFDSSRTLALHFYILSREGLSMEKGYATASVLIIIILVLNAFAYWLMRRFIRRAY
ncbi:MAG: Phosphate transport system permease protein PstA [Candidatus Hydrogenedentes bacterium ADurb.Bin101]|jgi:phosphate transport system permease protein|nr:MAG: Phosphate transport system permease protein PstA [Candidatus Hydrogenedentes bacterium ADurb.Bin101]HOC67376.1 phosphate ABC transporter permease PstA [Candidatus Hydrogenedentota bacterium]